jgi:protein TonB
MLRAENGGERLVPGRRLTALLLAGALGALVTAIVHGRGAAPGSSDSAAVRDAAPTWGRELGPTAEQEAGGLGIVPPAILAPPPSAADTARGPATLSQPRLPARPPAPRTPPAPHSPAAPRYSPAPHPSPVPHRSDAPPASSGRAADSNASSHGVLGSGVASSVAAPAPAPPSGHDATAANEAGDVPGAAQPVSQTETATGQGVRANDNAAGAASTAGTSGAPGDGEVTGASSGAGSSAVRAAPAAPVWTAPRVVSTGTTAYPGAAFHLSVRRQDLGASVAVAGSEGAVTVRAFVLADGVVRTVEVARSSGSGILDRAAVEAVRGWQFAPATRDGVPQDAYVTFDVRYVVR